MKQENWLLNNIIDTDQCAKCGTCTILCPNNILTFEDVPTLTDKCLRNGRGTCHEVCPRVSSSKYQIQIREKLEDHRYTTPLSYDDALKAIIKTLMDKDEIDGAIIVGEDHWKSLSLVVNEPGELEVEEHTHNYYQSPLAALEHMGEIDLERVAIVALPCQIQGFRKIQYFPYIAKHELEKSLKGHTPVKIPQIKYLIGHFCTEKYDHGNMMEVLRSEGINIEDVKKFKREVPKLKVETENDTYTLPLKPIAMNEGCKLCNDYEANMADISIGVEGKTTCINIRKDELNYFKDILDLTEDTEDLPKTRHEHKLNRFMVNVTKRQDEGKPVSYYWMGDYPGVGKQMDGNHFIRLKAGKSGWYTHRQLEDILDISKRYDLEIKITTRGAYELHNAKSSMVPVIIDDLKKRDLVSGSEGPLLRSTIACPGDKHCKMGLIDTLALSDKIEEKFAEYPTPYKFKIAISGCPNKCVRPTIHDIGIMGVVYSTVNADMCVNCGRCAEVCKVDAIDFTDVAVPNSDICIDCGKCYRACPNNAIELDHMGFEVFLGGKSGREVVEGRKVDIKDEDELFEFIEKVLILYNKLADMPQKERVADTIKKVGFDNFIAQLDDIKL